MSNWLNDEQIRRDSTFMEQALACAQKAYDSNEVPIGAIVVNAHGDVIGKGFNEVESRHTQTAHAEMNALLHAGKTMGDWRLNDCTIYVTLEPCAMCMYAIILSRCSRLVYGSASPLYGFSLDKYALFQLYQCPVSITQGVGELEASNLLKKFFKTRRGA